MNAIVLKSLDAMLPWDDMPSDEKRKRLITVLMIILALLFMFGIPFVKVPPKPRQEAVAVPERIARVIERKIELPPPPPPKPKEEVKPEEAKKDEVAQPKAAPTTVEAQKARDTASKALKDAGIDDSSLASLRDLLPAANVGNLITSTEEAGTSRDLISSRAGSGSGGLAAAGYSGQVSSGFGGGKAGGKGSSGVTTGSGTGLQTVKSGIGTGTNVNGRVGKDGKMHRTAEDIRKTFDNNGGRLNNLYQRALRDNPNMQGTVRLKLTIAPNGSVTSVSIASTQLDNKELEDKIKALVLSFNFGAYDVEIWNGSHDLNFFPSN